MKLYINILISIFILNVVKAQDFSTSLKFKNKTIKKQTVKFELVNNCIVIPVKINNSASLNFILDTDVEQTIITYISKKKLSSLKISEEETPLDFGLGQKFNVLKSYGNKISIGSIQGEYQNLLIVQGQELNLSRKFGIEINGIIGADIFKGFIIEINYIKKKIKFYNPDKFEYKRKYENYYELPLGIISGKPYINIPVKFNKEKTSNLKFLINTGKENALQIFPESDINILIPEKKVYDKLRTILNGNLYGYKSEVENIEIGEIVSENVTCIFTEKLERDTKINGIIGGELLRRFDIIIDYGNERISVRSNKNFRQEFNFNMCGIELEAPYLNLPVYLITELRENSPAEKAGFQIGDQIIAVNNVSTISLSLSKINSMFKSEVGKDFEIKILRAGVEIKINIRLEREF